jgi:hypothetical protein
MEGHFKGFIAALTAAILVGPLGIRCRFRSIADSHSDALRTAFR